MRGKVRHLLFLPLDLLLLLGALFVLFVLATGGGIYYLRGIRISSFSAANPIYFLILLSVLRYAAGKGSPFLGVSALSIRRLPDAAEALCRKVFVHLEGLGRRGAIRWVIAVLCVSAAIKLMNAWFYFGFYCGDDVEIHQITFAKLFHGFRYDAWDLRNPFYPLAFIYPIQALIHGVGVESEAVLVFAGRAVVVAFSLLTLRLLFDVGRREWGNSSAALLGVLALAMSGLHTTMASSELPRVVSGFFVLLCYFFSSFDRPARRQLRILASGVALGIAVAIRFGDIVFALPLVITLLRRRDIRGALAAGVVTLIVSAVLLGASDWLYRGDPLHSTRSIIEYTLLDKQSTRGFQPFYEYAASIGVWSSLFAVPLFLASFRARPYRLLSWSLIPIAVLSFLPHKEPRYLVPILPFFALLVGGGLWRLLGEIQSGVGEPRLRLSSKTKALILVVLVIAASLLEIDRFWFRRSETAVEGARWIAARQDARGAAVVQAWRAGALVYLWRLPLLDQIPRSDLEDREKMERAIRNPDVNCVLIPDRDVRRYGYDGVLGDAGYTEEAFTTRVTNNNYRLFHRP